MPNFRKNAREQILAVLAHATTGFNAQLAAIAASYSVTAFTIDWAVPSNNFAVAYLDPEGVAASTIDTFPCAVLYGGRAVDEKNQKYRKFSGQVIYGVDFYLQYRALTDAQHAGNAITNLAALGNNEPIADAVDDAFLEALNAGRSTFQTNGLTLSGFSADRNPVEPRGDGYVQRLAFTLGFEVHV